jgi:hypothetical protein
MNQLNQYEDLGAATDLTSILNSDQPLDYGTFLIVENKKEIILEREEEIKLYKRLHLLNIVNKIRKFFGLEQLVDKIQLK